MNKDEKRALGSAALHRKELGRKRLLEKGGTTMLITSGRVRPVRLFLVESHQEHSSYIGRPE